MPSRPCKFKAHEVPWPACGTAVARLYLSHFDERGMKHPYRLLLYLVSLFPENEQAMLLYSLKTSNTKIQHIISIDSFNMMWPEAPPELPSDSNNDSGTTRLSGDDTNEESVPAVASNRLSVFFYFAIILLPLLWIMILYKRKNI